jgi:enoyl-CoA hydratase/carnithine racemase
MKPREGFAVRVARTPTYNRRSLAGVSKLSDEIVLSTGAGVGRITINRGAKKNALTTAMYAAMADALAAFGADDEVQVVLIGGGPDFTAGNDLQDFMMASMGGASFHDLPVLRFLDLLRGCVKPIVASVRGNAVGIGTTMLLHCDVVVASATARFRLPFAVLGLVPEAGSSLLLPLTVGRGRASNLLMSGDFFAATEAHAMGLVNELVEDAATDEAAIDVAAKLALLPPEALRETKRLMKAPWEAQVKKQMADEAEAFTARLSSDEFRAAAMKLLSK